jgi:hypothetical protein
MSATAPPHLSDLRDMALSAIAEAHRLIGRTNQKPPQMDASANQRIKSKQPQHFDKPRGETSRFRLGRGSLIGLLGLASICVAVFAWQSSHGQVAAEPNSTSSISIKKNEELPTQPAPSKAKAAARTENVPPQPLRAPTMVDRVETNPAAAPVASESSPQIQMIVRERTDLRQGIDQLKAAQSQMVGENAKLAELVKASQEIARHNAEFSEELKAAQTQLARDNLNLAEQLKASQEQLTIIAEQLKKNQEQVARLVASQQKERPKTPASSLLVIAGPERRTPTSLVPPVRVQTPAPRQLPPKPQ